MRSGTSMASLCACRILARKWYSTRTTLQCLAKRTLLSPAYSCSEAWHKRLESPALQKLDISDFALKLQEKFDKEGKASAIDIDILANKLDQIDHIQLDFVQNLFYRFRHTSEATKMLESTPHSLIRGLLHLGDTERLLEILKDKIHYGVYLDYFTANLLLDHFIESQQYQEAAAVAFELMLQEDFVHPISRMLSWYACHLRWKHPPQPAEGATAEESAPVEDEEENWIKVSFIENPWYDDHFDIAKDTQLLGKTLTMVTRPCDDLVSRSYNLIGWGLYEKFETGLELLRKWTQDENVKQAVSEEALNQFRSSLSDVVACEPPPEIEPGLVTMEDVMPVITAEMKAGFEEELQVLTEKLKAAGKLILDVDLEQDLLSLTKEIISKVEQKDMKDQESLFRRWERERQSLLQQQVHEYQVNQRKEAITNKLNELKEREERLQYFEQRDKIKMAMKRGARIKEIKEVREEEQFVAPPQERSKKF